MESNLKKSSAVTIIETQNGNVLFILLIAVALFAALSYAVTSSNRSGGSDASGEKSSLIASQILQYMSSIKTARDRMIITGGYDQVRFGVLNGSESSQVYSGQNYVAGKAGGIFDPPPEGGGIPVLKIPEAWLSAIGDVLYFQILEAKVGSDNVGTDAADEVVSIKNLKKEVCEELNFKLTNSKNISNMSYVGSTNGYASQYVLYYNSAIVGLTTGAGNGISLPEMPICAYDTIASNYTFFYDIAQH